MDNNYRQTATMPTGRHTTVEEHWATRLLLLTKEGWATRLLLLTKEGWASDSTAVTKIRRLLSQKIRRLI